MIKYEWEPGQSLPFKICQMIPSISYHKYIVSIDIVPDVGDIVPYS